MPDNEKLITVISCYSHKADEITEVLISLKIPFVVSGDDAKGRFGILYFQIRVRPKDFSSARQIAHRHRAKYLLKVESAHIANILLCGNREKGLLEKALLHGNGHC